MDIIGTCQSFILIHCISTPTFFNASRSDRAVGAASSRLGLLCLGVPEQPAMVSVCLVLQNFQMGELKRESSRTVEGN